MRIVTVDLLRLMTYINGTVEQKSVAFTGESMASCQLAVFCDADLASDHEDSKSKSGIWIAVIGQYTYWPLIAIRKRQGATSYSTSEAELIAVELAIRQEAIPLVMLWAKCQCCSAEGNLRQMSVNAFRTRTTMPRSE